MPRTWLCPMTRLLVVALLSLGAVAHAESTLIGTVVAAETKQPAADVVVSAFSPALQGERVVVTDEQGRYEIPSLPPGTYTLRFEKDGTFQAFMREDLLLREGKSLRVNVELLPGGVSMEEMIGPCGPPLIEPGSTTTGRGIDSEGVARLALNHPSDPSGAVRSFDALAEWAPGVQRDAGGLSIHGASAFENAVVVDGLYTSDPLSGVNLHPLSVELLQDITVITGGYMPEYGRSMGGIITASTRTGSNEFHGSVFANWAPGILEGTRTPVASGGAGDTALKNLGDFGATLGGPLAKDRLWFFAGVAPALSRWAQTRAPSGDPRIVFADQRGIQGLGSLTYLINNDHNVSLSLSTSPTRSGGPGRLTVDPLTGGIQERLDTPSQEVGRGALDSNVTTTAVHYAGAVLDKKLLLDGHVGWSRQTRSQQPFEAGEELRVDRFQASTKANYMLNLAGQHLMKAGADAELRVSERPSRSTSHLLGGFVQDSWMMTPRLTLNAGVRYDVWSLDAGDGRVEPVRSNPLSPRLGVIVDPWANGRTKLFAHYARYHAPVPFLAESATTVPDLVLLGTTELVAGAETEWPSNTRLGANWTHRNLDPVHGESSARTYDAVSVSLSHDFVEGWLAEVSYTWSRLRGNELVPVIAAIEPGGLSDVGPEAAQDDGTGRLLPYQRPHFIKAFGAREFSLSRQVNASVGLSYRGSSGQRTPWAHALDSTLRLGYWPDLRRRQEVSFTLSVFNLLNAQEVTRVREASADTLVPVEYQSPRQVRLGARYTF